MPRENVIGVSDSAEIIGCSVSTVKRYVDSGRLAPVHQLPGRTGAYLFAREDIERLARLRAAEKQSAA